MRAHKHHPPPVLIASRIPVMQINLRGVVLGTKHASKAMIAAGTQGVIINTSSIAGYRCNVANSGDPQFIPAGAV